MENAQLPLNTGYEYIREEMSVFSQREIMRNKGQKHRQAIRYLQPLGTVLTLDRQTKI
jgi:hypothetical protein